MPGHFDVPITRVFTTSDLIALYDWTEWTVRTARTSGYVGAVEAPSFIRHSNRYVVTEHQMNGYQLRKRDFESKYLTAPRMSAFIGSRYGGVIYRQNVDAQSIAKLKPYFGVMPPHRYEFEGVPKTFFWHREDLELFRRFIAIELQPSPDRNNPVWDVEDQLWRPKYMPQTDYEERFAGETRLRTLGESHVE